MDYMAQAAIEAKWLIDNPQFEEKPASIREFLGEGYLNILDKVRPGLVTALVEIFGEEVNTNRIALIERAMVTGGIGIGKTTFASIALPYFCHWCLCLRDPQDYFGLLPGTRIAFMQMSTSEKQALEVVFGDIFARIKHADWFVQNYPHDPKFTKQIRFPQKDIWILPGDSAETTFEGYNILAGILDEMDSHKVTKDKDYADQGFDTIENRVSSRFPVLDDTGQEVGHRGLIIAIGQMKKSNGFAARKYKEFKRDPKAHVTRMAIWESYGWDRYMNPDGTRNSFWYDIKRKQIIPALAAEMIADDENVLEVPMVYLRQFELNPPKALKDLAGIPPTVEDSFIQLADRVDEARDRWIENQHESSPVTDSTDRPKFAEWFRATNDPRKRVCHIDWATSGDGDALGMAMGHVSHLVKVGEEEKPYIVLDFLMRIRANPGQEIIMSDVRSILYNLKDDLGFRLVKITMDGFQSTDTLQQLRKKRFSVDKLSVDKSTWPYEDLREAIYERRIEFPPYLTYLRKGDDKPVEIAIRELLSLQDTGRKIDHPADGSKDVADAMAGVVHTLMGDRTYRRGVGSTADPKVPAEPNGPPVHTHSQPGMSGLGGIGLQAPIPPAGLLPVLNVPPRLRGGSR